MFRSSVTFTRLCSSSFKLPASKLTQTRAFSTSLTNKMPEQLKKEEVDKNLDPAVAKQWDDKTPSDQKFKDFYAIADKQGVCMLGTPRDGIGVRPYLIT